MHDEELRLRVGVAGLGFGARVHVPGLLGIPGVRVVALAGTDLPRAESVAARIGAERGVASIEELFDLDLDAVTLALPPLVNETASLAALGRGIPVLCEKPLASNIAAAERLAGAAAGICTAVDFEFMETDTFAEMKRLIDSGVLGRFRSGRLSWQTESWGHRHGDWSWRMDSTRGGGVLALLACHAVYLLEWLLEPIDAISARLDDVRTRRLAPDGRVPAPDTVDLTFRMAGGGTFAGLITTARPGPPEHVWEMTFDKGTLTAANRSLDWISGFTLEVDTGLGAKVVGSDGDGGGDGRIKPFRTLARRFLSARSSGARMTPDFDAGLRVQQVLEAITTSSGISSWVEVV